MSPKNNTAKATSNVQSIAPAQKSALELELEALKAENAKLKSNATLSGGIKVSEKGGVSVYGLGRFPVTLYKSQWEKLFAQREQVEAFIKAHEGELKVKEAAAK